MKKILLLSALCVLALHSFAQEEATFFRPLQGDKTISFNFVGISAMALNSVAEPLTNSLMVDLRYFYKDDIAFRLGFGMKNLKTDVTTSSDTTGGAPLITTEDIDKATGFAIGLGVEKHIKTKAKRVDPFVGLGIIYSTLGDNEVTSDSKTLQVNGNFTQTKVVTLNPGSNALAIQLNVGFFWYFAHNIAFGGEIAFGWAGGTLGGDTKATTTTTTSTGGTVTTTEKTVMTTQKADFNAFQTTNTGAVELLVKF